MDNEPIPAISAFANKVGVDSSYYDKNQDRISNQASSQNYLSFLKPLYKVLNAMGLILPTADRGQAEKKELSVFKRMGIRNWILVLICYFTLAHVVTSAIMRQSSGVLNACFSIQRIIETLMTVLSVHHFLSHQEAIYGIFQSCSVYIAQLPTTEVQILRKRCRKAVIVFIVGFILSYSTLPRALYNLEYYISSNIYGINTTLTEFTETQEIALSVFDFVLISYCDAMSNLLMLAFVTVSFYVGSTAKFYEIKLDEARDSSKINPIGLHKIQKTYGEITALCNRTDAIFTRVTLAWYFDLVQKFLLLIPNVLSAVKKEPIYIYFGLPVTFIYYGYLFMIMSLSASRIKEVSYDGMLTVHRISNKIPSRDWHSLNMIVNLMGMMSTSQMHLTAWNFFIIDRSLILTVLSMVLTYTVVVIQFFNA